MAGTPNNNKEEKDKAVNVNDVSQYNINYTDTIRNRVNGWLTVNRAFNIINNIKRRKKRNVNPEEIRYLNRLKKELKEKHGIDLDNEFDREYVQVLYYEKKTVGIKVPLIYHYKWRKIRENQLLWELFKASFLELIDAFIEREKEFLLRAEAKKHNVNINLTPVVVYNNVEAKAESNSSVNIDVSGILAELEEIRKLVYNWYKLNMIPKAAFDNVSMRIKKIEKLMRGVN